MADQGIQTPEPAVDGILDRNEENCQEWTPMVEEIEINCPYLPTNGIGRHGSLVKGLRWFCAYLVYGFLSNFMFYILPMQMKRSTMNKIDKTAIILIGFQNDYFRPEGILTGALEDSEGRAQMLSNTLELLEAIKDREDVLVISTPIQFTENYSELNEPTGILKTIKDTGAFCRGSSGSETIEQFEAYSEVITEVKGKRGLNAFSNTDLESILRSNDVDKVALAGVVTSICIDSTGRSAHEKGFEVTVLSDCTAGRTAFEQQFYCEQIFPLYAEVGVSKDLMMNSGVSA